MKDLLNALKENGMLWFYMVSLISSDSLWTPEDCDKSIELLKQTMEALPESNLTDDEKEKVMEHCQKGLEICKMDKMRFLRNKNKTNMNTGTQSIGVKAPLIKEGDDIIEIVVNSVLEATKMSNGKDVWFDIWDGDIVGVTESVIARSQGNYVTIDEIADEIKKKYGEDAIIDVIEPIYSRNRFAMILKGIARGAKKLRILMPPVDEVGNVSENHPFTKMNYKDYYAEICANENCDVEIYTNPNYLEHKQNLNLLFCQLHKTKYEAVADLRIYLNGSISNEYSLMDICNDKCEYGLLGSNKSTEEKLKLFPRKADFTVNGKEIKGSDRIVNEIKDRLQIETGADVSVVIYADGCFRDPVGGIWEFADPVSMVSYTDPNVFESTPNEIKLKAYIDENINETDDLEGYIKNEVKTKKDLMGKMDSQGTTPRLIRDLVASLMDLTSGSGDKATPIVLVKNYFKNYAND